MVISTYFVRYYILLMMMSIDFAGIDWLVADGVGFIKSLTRLIIFATMCT